MKKHLTDFFIAIFVIACSLLIVGSLAFALSGWAQGKKGGRVVEIDFTDVTGIHLHSEVRYAGAPAGSISAVRLLTPAERKNAQGDSPKRNAVRVTAILREDLPALPADVRASITSDTMLSDKFVAFSAGNPDGPTLPPNAILQGQSAAGLDALIESVGPMFKTAETMIQDLAPLFKKTTTAVDTFNHGIGEALPKVSKLVDGLKSTSDSADLAIKRVDKLVHDLEQPVKADGINDRAGQNMCAGFRALFHDNDCGIGRNLFQPDGRRKARRPPANDHHVVIHALPLGQIGRWICGTGF